ncbi:MAG: Cytochrome c5 [Gammaproteobacteria bacterium]|jgi:cytochrome c5|nr:Cytochrome c5 [Gammaproteobacteria bacterium]
MKTSKSIIILLSLSSIAGFSISLYTHRLSDMRFETQPYHYPIQFVTQLKNDPEAGKKIFKEYCASCHAPVPIIPVNAPKIDDKIAWKIRYKKGISLLLKRTIEGVGAMPARGGCFECSDAQLQAAMYYILQNALTKKYFLDY